MPCSRQRTGTSVPVSPCFKMAMMALSLYLEVFMKSLSAQLGLKFYFYMVLFLGGITNEVVEKFAKVRFESWLELI